MTTANDTIKTVEERAILNWNSNPAIRAEFHGNLTQYAERLRLEERAAAEWESNPATRAEFGNDLTRYMAYLKASESGRIKAGGRGSS